MARCSRSSEDVVCLHWSSYDTSLGRKFGGGVDVFQRSLSYRTGTTIRQCLSYVARHCVNPRRCNCANTLSKIAILIHIAPAFDAPSGGSPSEYCQFAITLGVERSLNGEKITTYEYTVQSLLRQSLQSYKCSFANNKAKFCKAFNNIFGKVVRNASEEVLFALIKTKCLPILFYGVEACPTNSSVRQSFEFTMNKILFKVFGATSKDSYRQAIFTSVLVLIMRSDVSFELTFLYLCTLCSFILFHLLYFLLPHIW